MLSRELELTLNLAFRDARGKRHEFITVEHLMLALLDNESAVQALKACGAEMISLRRELQQYVDEATPLLPVPDGGRETQPTLGFQRVLQRAVFHVQSSGKREVNGANVLVAIFSEQESQAVYLLKLQSISRLDVVNFLSHGVQSEEESRDSDASEHEAAPEAAADSALANYTVNLNEMAKKGKLDPLVGREHEIERAIQVLCRRRKNNPVLVGEPGVGKTAIAEGLAWLVVEKKVPEAIADAVVYSLDIGALLAGTKYRGDFEKRF